MNNKFDELTKQMAQSVTRRAALKKFGISLAGMALACFGLAGRAQADPKKKNCLQSGFWCYEEFDAAGSLKYCQKCCNGYTCRLETLGWVCICQ